MTRYGVLAGTGVAAAIVIATVAARHADPAEVSPVTPRGGWNTVWVAAVTAALVLYAVGVALTRTHLAAVVVLALVVQLAPLAAPLLLSKDAYLYWMGARIAVVHHASPYRDFPDAYPDDPALPHVAEQWRDEGSPYGPTWVALSVVPSSTAGSSRAHAVSAYKLFSALGVLAALALVAFGTRSAAAVALLGWNPLVALHFAGGGHSDGWLVALLCLGVLARRRARGGAAWALAGAFKPVGIVLFPLDLAADRLRRPRGFWIGLGVAAAVILVLSTAAWGAGWIRTALVGVHGTAPLGGVHWLTEAGLGHRSAVVVGALVFAVVYCVLLVRAWRDGRAGLSFAATALCLTSSLLRPWYAIWPVALAAVEEDSAAALAAVALTGYLLLGDAVAF
jgi:hypothetical protein